VSAEQGNKSRRSGRRRWLRIVAVSAAVVLVVGAVLTVDWLVRKTVTVDVDGSLRRLHTHADSVQAALTEAGVHLAAEDLVFPAPETPLRDHMTITVRKAHTVFVQADGVLHSLRTQARHPLDVLAELSVSLAAHDLVEVDGQPYTLTRLAAQGWNTPPLSIRVLRSATIQVVENGTTLVLHTTQADVGRALDAAGVSLYVADRVIPDLSTPVADGLVIAIERSLPLTVVADGQTIVTRALGPTVGDALAQIGVAPVGLDMTIPPLETPLTANMTVQVVRVSEDLILKEEPIPFETIIRRDSTLAPGEQRVIQEGIEGLRRRQVRVRLEDGQEVSRETVAEWIAQTPVPRVIAQGS
jgi:uncharacterized protein YabE (DUF348 family)